jgi:polyhydroxybutyrate depolymerase
MTSGAADEQMVCRERPYVSEPPSRCSRARLKRRTLVFSSILVSSALAAACSGRRMAAPDAQSGNLTIQHDGRTRSYLLRVPAELPSNGGRVAVVLVLHGGGGNAASAESMTEFTPLARSEGFIVAYPEGSARRGRLLTWNAGHCCGHAMQERVDDVGFLSTLIDDLLRRYPIDPNRVFVTGMSNGAMMSHRVGIELSSKVAAIAPVVGGTFGDEWSSGQGVSAVMINGMLDRSVPYEGGSPGGLFFSSWDGTPVRPAREQASFWAQNNGCASEPTSSDRVAYVHVRYSCRAPLGVEFYSVRDNGHAWPGGQRGSRLGDSPSQALNATRVIWEFFSAHPKP